MASPPPSSPQAKKAKVEEEDDKLEESPSLRHPLPLPSNFASLPVASPPPSSPHAEKAKVEEEEEKLEEAPSLRPPLPLPPDASKPRYKRRKLAIFFGYCGHGYQGMQKNPGAKTIESELEDALYLSFAVPESDRGLPRRYDWARSARTDKGVSAAGQVVSGRFYADPPGLVDRLNSHLPPQIRIFGYKRVTASFNAKKFCDRRRYVYLLPVFALDPEAHRDRESVLASLGSANELTKCPECSERGRKVPGLMGRCSTKTQVAATLATSKLGDALEFQSSSLLVGNSITAEEERMNETTSSSLALEVVTESTAAARGEEGSVEVVSDEILQRSEANLVAPCRGKFEYGEKVKERFNGILNRYVGTHNFHNFTTRTKAEDPSARRYIVSFDANNVFNLGGSDFIKCEVVGQSFMLHQIRKMIGLAVAIMRNCAPESIMDIALKRDIRINVPTAPEVGLYLEECLFTSYNQKWKCTHDELSMSSYVKEAEDFKMRHIYQHIASMEKEEGSVALWLHSLNHRNYPDMLLEEGTHLINIEACAEKSSPTEVTIE